MIRMQRHRLKEALERFYGPDLSGDHVAFEAAVCDISMPIRVMVHGASSLLHQYEPSFEKREIHFDPLIAEPVRTSPSGVKIFSAAIPVNLAFGSNATKFVRYKRGDTPDKKVPLEKWWNDPCWDSGSNEVSNKDLVLAIANKEGGAHVDGDTSAKYRTAKSQGKILINGRPISDIARMGGFVGRAGDELLEYLDEHFPETAS